jgi:peptide deformylase
MIYNEMTILEIMVFGHPVLATKADKIKNIDDDLCRLANNMVYTMHVAPGIGLAAPQVNQSIRLITVDLSVGEKNEEIIILANPEILDSHGETILEEGCQASTHCSKRHHPRWQREDPRGRGSSGASDLP